MSANVCEFTPPCLYTKPATSKGSMNIYRQIYVCVGIEILLFMGTHIWNFVCMSVNVAQSLLAKAFAYRQRCLYVWMHKGGTQIMNYKITPCPRLVACGDSMAGPTFRRGYQHGWLFALRALEGGATPQGHEDEDRSRNSDSLGVLL